MIRVQNGQSPDVVVYGIDNGAILISVELRPELNRDQEVTLLARSGNFTVEQQARMLFTCFDEKW